MKIDLRSVGLTLAALAALGAVGGVSTVAFGLYNVSAREGHWPVVPFVLHTTYRQNVRFRAPAESEVPDLTQNMASLGAKHYDAACRVCHSAPGYGRTATMRAMVPQPPHITEATAYWEANHFQWILYEGVKMSGMPHWPAARPDEVWPVVAFLMEVKRGMNRDAYDTLTAVPKADPRGFEYCATCHETDGVSDNPHIPRLDILSQEYMTRTLLAYRSGARDSGFMEHAASEEPRDALPGYAARFAAVEPTGEAGPVTALTLEGERIAREGTDPNVPTCVSCHGPWPEDLNEGFPSISGQYEGYLVDQLALWREGVRGGSKAAELMHAAAERLTDEEIAAVAAWYAARKPEKINQEQAAQLAE